VTHARNTSVWDLLLISRGGVLTSASTLEIIPADSSVSLLALKGLNEQTFQPVSAATATAGKQTHIDC
jgi:hypothetical protein